MQFHMNTEEPSPLAFHSFPEKYKYIKPIKYTTRIALIINEFRFSLQRIFISNAFTNIIIVKINVNMQITLLYVYLHYAIYICKSGKFFYFEVILIICILNYQKYYQYDMVKKPKLNQLC